MRQYKTDAPRPGDIGLVHITGFTGALITAGQWLVGSASYWTHAFVVVEDGMVVQAQPGGAERIPLADAVAGRRVVYSDLQISADQRGEIIAHANRLVGTPYSYLDYVAIAAARWFRWRRPMDYVEDERHMICSQLADESYWMSGVCLFPNRDPGDVAPGDIARRIGAPNDAGL